jgi:hypothetical protein
MLVSVGFPGFWIFRQIKDGVQAVSGPLYPSYFLVFILVFFRVFLMENRPKIHDLGVTNTMAGIGLRIFSVYFLAVYCAFLNRFFRIA